MPRNIEKNGKMPIHCTTNTPGKLSSVEIKTRICYQEFDGGKNYHDSPAFDIAMAQVIRENFGNLAAQALDILINKCRDKKRAAQEEYQEMFNVILKEENE